MMEGFPMSRLSQFTAILAVAMLAVLPLTARAAEPADAIEYRKNIMKTLGAQGAALALIMQKKVPADNVAVHAQILATTATIALKAFEPKVEGGDAKPEIWTQWADFSKKMNEFAAGTAELAKAAQAGGLAAAQPKMQAALTCRGCHDTYRNQK